MKTRRGMPPKRSEVEEQQDVTRRERARIGEIPASYARRTRNAIWIMIVQS